MVLQLKIVFEIYTGMYLEELTESRLHKIPLHWWTSVCSRIHTATGTLPDFLQHDSYFHSFFAGNVCLEFGACVLRNVRPLSEVASRATVSV